MLIRKQPYPWRMGTSAWLCKRETIEEKTERKHKKGKNSLPPLQARTGRDPVSKRCVLQYSLEYRTVNEVKNPVIPKIMYFNICVSDYKIVFVN
jgi:hypothetical protein